MQAILPADTQLKTSAVSQRIESVDFVRGLVMIIMALDHVRDLLHSTSLTQSPTDLNVTTPILFFTRWITYLCAPVFVFLSGVSVYLSSLRATDVRKFRSFLVKRGVWLIILEFTLINFTLWFDVEFRILMLQVIAAIGFGLIILASLLKVRSSVLMGIALVIICGHNLLPAAPGIQNSTMSTILAILFQQRLIITSPDFFFLVAYPLIPWFGIMLLGFALGKLFTIEVNQRNKTLITIGLTVLVLFVVFRLINSYGDPRPWTPQDSTAFTMLSFLNVTKYPPSLLFDLLFLGIMFLLLGFSEKFSGKLKQVITVYGSVPMFYYLLHLLLIRFALFIMVLAQGYQWKDLSFAPFQFGRPAAPSGISLGWVYLVWLAVVILLYPLCKRYSVYKAKHKEKWSLRYL